MQSIHLLLVVGEILVVVIFFLEVELADTIFNVPLIILLNRLSSLTVMMLPCLNILFNVLLVVYYQWCHLSGSSFLVTRLSQSWVQLFEGFLHSVESLDISQVRSVLLVVLLLQQAVQPEVFLVLQLLRVLVETAIDSVSDVAVNPAIDVWLQFLRRALAVNFSNRLLSALIIDRIALICGPFPFV